MLFTFVLRHLLSIRYFKFNVAIITCLEASVEKHDGQILLSPAVGREQNVQFHAFKIRLVK